MKENKVYLKDLTAKGQFNLSITASNDVYPLTATTVNVSFEGKTLNNFQSSPFNQFSKDIDYVSHFLLYD